MAARSIAEIVDANWAFTVADAARLIDIVGMPPRIDPADLPDEIDPRNADAVASVLAMHLNRSAVDLRWEERRQSMPAPREVAKRAAMIASLCKRIRVEACDAGGNLLDGLGSGALHAFAAVEDGKNGAEAVERAFREICRLEGWASALSNRAGSVAGGKPARRGRNRDEAWHRLIDRLGGVYFQIWGERPGLSRDPATQKPGGPYFRFVKAVADILLPRRRTDEAIATTLSQHRWPTWAE